MATITTIGASDTITSSRTTINDNFSSLNSAKIESTAIDTDTTLAANSDVKVPSQKAIKTYVDTVAATSYLVPTGAILPYAAAAAPSNFLLCDGSAVSRSTYATLFALVGTTYGSGNGSTTFNVPDLRGRFPLGYASSAQTKTLTFSSRSGNTITITGADNHAHNEVQTGQAVLYDTTSGAISGLSDNTTYYLIRVAYNQFQLATSVANANAGTAITLSSDGSGTQTFTITYTARSLAQTGGEETHALTDAELPSHSHSFGLANGGTGATLFDDASNGSTNNSTEAGSDALHNNMPPFLVIQYIIKT
jgi:microcystin-dependent protein